MDAQVVRDATTAVTLAAPANAMAMAIAFRIN